MAISALFALRMLLGSFEVVCDFSTLKAIHYD